MSKLLIALILICAVSCSTPKILDKPIQYNEERERLSLEYMKVRYNLEKKEARIDPKMIVLHWTVIPTMEKTFDAFDPVILPSHRAGIKSASALNVSSHFLVDQDGTIYRLLPERHFARHVIGLNHCAIGVENVGGTDDLPLTKAQIRSNRRLVRYLSKKYDIEFLIGHHEYQAFIGHDLWLEVDPGYLTEKEDPGDYFMSEVRKKIKRFKLSGPPIR